LSADNRGDGIAGDDAGRAQAGRTEKCVRKVEGARQTRALGRKVVRKAGKILRG
jgi:hypothetical protein